MVAIIGFDGDGYSTILAIVKDDKSINNFIKEYTDYKPLGYQSFDDDYENYYCIRFDEKKDENGIIFTVEQE